MRGHLLVERENAQGDKTILKSFDGEDAGALAESTRYARTVFAAATALRVRIWLDRPDHDPQLKLLFKIDEWGRERSWSL